MDIHTSAPMQFFSVTSPRAAGMYVIDAIAGGIANVVEVIATPPFCFLADGRGNTTTSTAGSAPGTDGRLRWSSSVR
jgi:hypothetical protein